MSRFLDRAFGGARAIVNFPAAVVAVLFYTMSPAYAEEIHILAFGDSLTAGYGLAEPDAFPARLEAALRERGVPARVVNAGVSGDTTAGGAARIAWALSGPPDGADGFDLVIVALGGNDGLRGLEPAGTEANLDAILTKARASGAAVLLSGMRAPPNLGRAYGERFDAVFARLAERHGVAFDPFFLEGVAADPDLNLADGIHPNPQGVEVMVARMVPLVLAILAPGAGS